MDLSGILMHALPCCSLTNIFYRARGLLTLIHRDPLTHNEENGDTRRA
jgi:hypothetical protein